MKSPKGKVILVRLTTKFGWEHPQTFASLDDALIDTEDYTSSIQRATVAWAIYDASDKNICLAWGAYGAAAALGEFGPRQLIVGQNPCPQD